MNAATDPRTGLQDLDRDECFRLLAHAPLGRLGVVVGGYPLIFPVNFTLDGQSIVMRTDKGTKLYGTRNAPVVFECDGINAMYHTGWSVLVLADAEEVCDPVEIERLEHLPVTPWCSASKSTWLRLRPKTITGRQIPPHGRDDHELELR